VIQVEGICTNNKILRSLADYTPKRFTLIISSIILLIIWILLSSFFRVIEYTYINIFVTAVTFIVIGILLIEGVTPCLPKRVRHFLILLIILKLFLGLAYFNYTFVSYEENIATIYKYGDSFFHHQIAMGYSQYWLEGNLFKNPNYLSPQVEQWGYDYFLGILYYVTGPLPEIGIIINNFLFLVFCLLSYKLFIIANLSYKDATSGLIILSFAPGLWLWSSYLYKESLLFVVVITSMLGILKMIKEFKLKWLLLLIVLQILLLTLRYSYVFVIIIMFLVALFYIKTVRVDFSKRLAIILLYCLFLFLLIICTSQLNFYKFGILDVLTYINSGLKIETSGGRFMTQGLGKSININNFFYVLPTKALYILVEPFPWFSAHSFVKLVAYVFSHMDAIYYFSLLIAVALAFVNGRKISTTKEQKLLLLIGVSFFVIPLFMFFPTRRYISVCIPFLMAYALPVWLKKQNFFIGMLISIMIVLSIHLFYYLSGWYM